MSAVHTTDVKSATATAAGTDAEDDSAAIASGDFKMEMRKEEDSMPPLPRVPTVELKEKEKAAAAATAAAGTAAAPATAAAANGDAKWKPGQTHYEGFRLLTEEDVYEMIQNTTPSVATATGVPPASLAYPIPSNLKLTPLDESGWSQCVDTPACSAWSKKEANGMMRFKCVGTIRGQTAETIFKLIFDPVISAKWGDAWKCQLPFDRINEWNEVLYMIANTPIGVSYRDFIQMRCSWSSADKQTHVIAYRNGAHAKYPEPLSKKNGYVRGETIGVVGYVIRTLPPAKDGTLRCAVVVITCFDLKGYIPKSIVNWAAQRIPTTWSGKLQLVCDKWTEEWSKIADPNKIKKI